MLDNKVKSIWADISLMAIAGNHKIGFKSIHELAEWCKKFDDFEDRTFGCLSEDEISPKTCSMVTPEEDMYVHVLLNNKDIGFRIKGNKDEEQFYEVVYPSDTIKPIREFKHLDEALEYRRLLFMSILRKSNFMPSILDEFSILPLNVRHFNLYLVKESMKDEIVLTSNKENQFVLARTLNLETGKRNEKESFLGESFAIKDKFILGDENLSVDIPKGYSLYKHTPLGSFKYTSKELLSAFSDNEEGNSLVIADKLKFSRLRSRQPVKVSRKNLEIYVNDVYFDDAGLSSHEIKVDGKKVEVYYCIIKQCGVIKDHYLEELLLSGYMWVTNNAK